MMQSRPAEGRPGQSDVTVHLRGREPRIDRSTNAMKQHIIRNDVQRDALHRRSFHFTHGFLSQYLRHLSGTIPGFGFVAGVRSATSKSIRSRSRRP